MCKNNNIGNSRINYFWILFFRIMIFSYIFYVMWESMLVSYLAATIIVLPFDGINTLMSQTDYKVAVQPGTYGQSVFEDSLDPIWQSAWKERTEPYLDHYKSYYSETFY